MKKFLLKTCLILALSLFSFLNVFFSKKVQAWETWGSIPMGVGMEEAIDQLEKVAVGAGKQAAAEAISETVYSAVSGEGEGGGVKFITSWENTLTINPKKEASAYIDELATGSTQMTGTSFYTQEASTAEYSINFEGVGKEGLAQYFQSPQFIESAQAQTSSFSGSSNYSAQISQFAKDYASNQLSENKCTLTYAGNTNDMFSDGNFLKFSQFMSGTNDPWSYTTCMENAYQQKLEEKQEEAKTEAVAYKGFKSTKASGNVIYPGSLVYAKVANVENMGNEIIADADGLPELIISFVTKLGVDAMKNGIGNVQSQVQSGATNVSNKAQSQVQNQVQNYGPGAMFGNSSMPSAPTKPSFGF